MFGRRSPRGFFEHVTIGAVNEGEGAAADLAFPVAGNFDVPVTLAGYKQLFENRRLVRVVLLAMVFEHLIGAGKPRLKYWSCPLDDSWLRVFHIVKPVYHWLSTCQALSVALAGALFQCNRNVGELGSPCEKLLYESIQQFAVVSRFCSISFKIDSPICFFLYVQEVLV